MSKNLVLAGGGHAHLYSLARTAELVRAGADVTLIAPHRHHYYSGMGPGMLARTYTPEQARVDVERLVTRGGGTFVQGRVERVDAGGRKVLLEDGRHLPFDLLSLNVGSTVDTASISGAELAFTVKPVEHLEQLRTLVLSRLKDDPDILVIGDGPAGVEIAGNLRRLADDHGARPTITIAGKAPRLLPRFFPPISRRAQRLLITRDIRFRPGFSLAALEDSTALAADGRREHYDIAVLATGIRPRSIFGTLPTAPDGALRVNASLQSIANENVFGSGDCISYAPRPLDRVGVYAVRQGPVLFQNLLASLAGRPLRPFHPQRHYLLILNLGNGTGLLIYGGLCMASPLAFHLKDRIDRRFISRFQSG